MLSFLPPMMQTSLRFHKLEMTDEAPLDYLTHLFVGRNAKKVERKVDFMVGKVSRSLMFFPKIRINSELIVDDQKTTELSLTTSRRPSTSSTTTITSVTTLIKSYLC